MFTRFFDTLCVRVLSSPALGRVVRAVILASRDDVPCGEAPRGATGTMIPVR